jgi:histidine triad (HIT) family protein
MVICKISGNHRLVDVEDPQSRRRDARSGMVRKAGGVDCVFCRIVAGAADASVVYEDDRLLAFCDVNPVNPGHLLIIPKIHRVGLVDLDESDGIRMFVVAQRLAAAVQRSGLRCQGVNLFLADGKAAGQEVFHVHLHMFPRYMGDRFRLDSGQRRASRRDLDEIAARVRAVL